MKPFKIVIEVNEDSSSMIKIDPPELQVQLELVQNILLMQTRMIERELTIQATIQRYQKPKVQLVHDLPNLTELKKQ